MKLLPQEIRRIRANALLETKFSPSTQQVILRKETNDFAKDLFTTIQRNKRIKNTLVLVVVLEIAEEEK